MKIEICTNEATLAGKIVSPVTFDHEFKEKVYYKFFVTVKRNSGVFDTIPILLSEKLYKIYDFCEGAYVYIKGQYISYREKDTRKILLYVCANELEFLPTEYYTNEILLTGYVAEKGQNRKTPLGKTIMDIKLIVYRKNERSSYIPCIIWELSHSNEEKIKIGEKISIRGRIQSREYTKKYDDGNKEIKVTYEVSAFHFSINK